MRSFTLRSAFAVLTMGALGALPLAEATAADFVVKPGKTSKVVFESRAAMEKFEGRTSRLEGLIRMDPTALGDSAAVRFEVDLASLDTGIKMRNAHMRDNHLETAKFPRAIFEGLTIQGRTAKALAFGVPESLTVEGTFALHGIRREIRLAVEVTYRPTPAPARIEFRAEFPIALADYAIERPQFLFLKLADVQTIRVSGVATAVGKSQTP